MKTKPNLQPGDIVWYYISDGTKVKASFVKWDEDFIISSLSIRLHYRAVQGIIRKKRAREWWINEVLIRQKGTHVTAMGWDSWFESACGSMIRTTPPENSIGWIHVVEQVKRKNDNKEEK